MSQSHDESKRKFVKAVGYVAPAILTLKAVPAFAAAGSGRDNHHHHHSRPRGNNGIGNGKDPQPPSRPFTPPRTRPNDD